MSDKPDPGYVRFWIENGTEVAMCTAQDFRAAMNERDELRAEVEQLREGDHLEYSLAVTNNELRAEGERLRAALVEIAEAATPYPETLRRIAHDALARS